MNRKVFYDRVRHSLFRGRVSFGQLKGCEAILDAFEQSVHDDRRWLAYMLATSYHETAHTMLPIKEYGGRAYYMRMYDKTGSRPHVAKRLGNTQKGDGALFCGRGYVQLTGRRNYTLASEKVSVDLVSDPDKAMEPDVAAQIMIEGMVEGWFTGRRLGHYFTNTRTDWVNARRIINGTDKASLIAGYARKFYAAILRADEPLKSPEELQRSRTVKASAAVGLIGSGTIVYDVINAADQARDRFSMGDIYGIVVGLLVLGLAIYIAYVRWDDAGRPTFRQIMARETTSDATDEVWDDELPIEYVRATTGKKGVTT